MARAVSMAKNVLVSPRIVSNGSARVKWARAAIVAIWVVAALSGRVALAGPFDPSGGDWEGYGDFVHLLREELGTSHVIVTNLLDWGALRPGDTLLLVNPDQSPDSASAGAFVRAGGRLGLFDDFGASEDLLGSFNIQRVPLPAHPRLALRDNPDLAVADPGPNAGALTQGVEHVVTNHAIGLSQPLLTTVLLVRGRDEGDGVPLALTAASGEGHLFVIGDPSFAMNAMLRYPGNRELARNIAHYLSPGSPQARGHFYLLTRHFTETGSFAGETGPLHDWMGSFRRARAEIGRDGLPPWILYWLAFVVATAVLFWLVPRTTRTYRSAAPRFTRPTPREAHGGAAGHAAALGAKQAYRGHAMLEWRRALIEGLTAYFGLPDTTSSGEVLRRVGRLGVVDGEAIRRVERVLVRMAEIDTMIAAKQTHALEPIRDEEVVATGELFQRFLSAVLRQGERIA